MSTDPYVPPKAELLLSDEENKYLIDSLYQDSKYMLLRRIAALFIDYVVCSFLVIISALIIPSFFFGYDAFSVVLILFWKCLIALLYFSLMEGMLGYSVGKLVCKIRVVNKNGQIPGIPRALVRSLFRLIEAYPYYLPAAIPAGLIVSFSAREQRLGDMAAKTYVVSSQSVEKFRPATKKNSVGENLE